MIQVIFEFDGGYVPFTPAASVSGMQVFFDGRFFQVLEGPELEVMAAAYLLISEGHPMAQFEIETRSVHRWRTKLRYLELIPTRLAHRLRSFAETTDLSQTTEGTRAVNLLHEAGNGTAPRATAFGRSFGPRVEGVSGHRAWVAV
ncbi:MAG: hypothetical protein AAF718_02340 [Pseudomonadota bacterium]